MHGVFVTELADLFAATEAVSDKDGGGVSGFDGGDEIEVRNCTGDLVLVRFKAEGTGHAAAGGVDGIDRGSRASQHGDFVGGSPKNGLVVAVAMKQDVLAFECADAEAGSLLGKEVSEEPGLIFQELRSLVSWEKLMQFVLEDTGTAWFKKDEGQAGIDLQRHALKDFGQVAARCAEEAEIVQWTAAANMALRSLDSESGTHKNRLGRDKGLRMVVVVPRIRPQHHHLRWGHLRCG